MYLKLHYFVALWMSVPSGMEGRFHHGKLQKLINKKDFIFVVVVVFDVFIFSTTMKKSVF